jgi:hypothetical protein
MNPVGHQRRRIPGWGMPTPEYTIAYTGNYTTSADANRRNKAAALKLLRKLLKHQGFVPDAIVTDGLASLRSSAPRPWRFEASSTWSTQA